MDSVAYAALYMNLSAIFLRWLRFGAEDSLNDLDARTMMQMVLMSKDEIAQRLLPIIYMRAAVLEDHEVRELLEDTGLIAMQQSWIQSFEDSKDITELQRLISVEEDPEALVSAQLFAARSNPQIIQDDWFSEAQMMASSPVPLIANRLCAVAAKQRPDLCDALLAYLRNHHLQLLCHDPDTLLATLVQHSQSNPQKTLAPFENCYGEWTLLAAATWHWERNQNQEALALTGSVRHLSPIFNQACLIRCQILAAAQDRQAWDLAAAIEVPNLARQALIALVQHFTNEIPTETIIQAIIACTEEEPETAFNLLVALIKDKQTLPESQLLVHVTQRFPHSTQITQLCQELQGMSDNAKPSTTP